MVTVNTNDNAPEPMERTVKLHFVGADRQDAFERGYYSDDEIQAAITDGTFSDTDRVFVVPAVIHFTDMEEL